MAFCVFCSPRTVPKHCTKKYEAVLADEMVSICQGPFLQCSECGACAGRKCLKEVLSLMDETVRFSDEWSSVVHNFVNSEGTTPTSIVGHCCEHQWLKKNYQSKNPLPSTKQRLDQAKTPTKRQRRMHLSLPQSPPKLGYLNKNNSISIDGYMYFPELRLFIDNTKDVVDIHALAGMNNAYKALWHCVPSESTVLQAKMMNLHPQQLSCCKQYYKLEKLKVYIPDMWGRTRVEDAKLEDVTVDLYTILKHHKEFDTNRKGYNDLSAQETRKGYLFEPVSDGHVSVVIAPE